jgi:hypothetical protein
VRNVTELEQVEQAHAQLARCGEMVLALAAFLRSTVPHEVGGTTVHLVAGADEWERLLTAANEVAQ